jgi:hypothetical protein
VIDLDFRKLYGLTVLLAPPERPGEVLPLQLPVYMDEIQRCVDVLNAVERDHVTDVERNAKFLVRDEGELKRRPEAVERLERLMQRELYRLVAYLTYSTTLAGVVEEAYDDLLKKLAACDATAATSIRAAHQARIDALEAELAPAVLVRNKVFAHTAFASPRKDSESTRFTSLQYLTGNPYGWGPEGLVIGGRFTFDGDPTPELQPVAIRPLARVTFHYLSGWRELLREALARISQLSDADICAGLKDKHAVGVDRDGAPPTP